MVCVLAGLVLTLGGAAYKLCGDLGAARAAAEDRRAAVRAAGVHGVNLLSISHTTVDRDIARLLGSSTGAVRRAYEQRSAEMKDTTVTDKVVQTGVLRSAGLVSIAGATAQVLVVADVVIRWEGSKTPPQERYYRWKMEVTKAGGAWLVSKVEPIQ
ncbi:hypothetical protein GCM10023259_103090 [Thermocatellispora tengchongensis]